MSKTITFGHCDTYNIFGGAYEIDFNARVTFEEGKKPSVEFLNLRTTKYNEESDCYEKCVDARLKRYAEEEAIDYAEELLEEERA